MVVGLSGAEQNARMTHFEIGAVYRYPRKLKREEPDDPVVDGLPNYHFVVIVVWTRRGDDAR